MVVEILSDVLNIIHIATLSLAVVPAKVLSDRTYKIRISISHKHVTRYIASRFEVDSPI